MTNSAYLEYTRWNNLGCCMREQGGAFGLVEDYLHDLHLTNNNKQEGGRGW